MVFEKKVINSDSTNVYSAPDSLNGLKQYDVIFELDIQNLPTSSFPANWSKYYDNSLSAWCISAVNYTSANIYYNIPFDFRPYAGCVLRVEASYYVLSGTKPVAIDGYMYDYATSGYYSGAGFINSSAASLSSFRNIGSGPITTTLRGDGRLRIIMANAPGIGIIKNARFRVAYIPNKDEVNLLNVSAIPKRLYGNKMVGCNLANTPGWNMQKSVISDLKNSYSGMNLLRWQLTYLGHDTPSADYTNYTNYMSWLNTKLVEFDKALIYCKQQGIKVILDMHITFGDVSKDGGNAFFNDPYYLQKNIDTWVYLAQRYSNNPSIYAFGIKNEPHTSNSTLIVDDPQSRYSLNVLSYQELVIKEVLKYAPNAKFTVAFPSSQTKHIGDYIKPLPFDNIIYEYHTYFPGEYCLSPASANTYPGWYSSIEGMTIDKNALRSSMQDIRNFQLKYNVPILIGEFGTCRSASNASQWLLDMISIFEEYGWDWTFFEGYSNNNAFNPQFPNAYVNNLWDESLVKDTVRPTPRESVLSSGTSGTQNPYTSADLVPTPVMIISAYQSSSKNLNLKWLETGSPVSAYNINYLTSATNATFSTSADNIKISIDYLNPYNINVSYSNSYGSATTLLSGSGNILTPITLATSASKRAYGLRLLNSGYSGPIVRLRRSSDNAEADIYSLPNGGLDIISATTFISGATSGAIKIWYDQSGSGYNLIQNNTSNQAILLSSGNLILANNLPTAYFNGNSYYSDGNAFIYNSSGATINMVVNTYSNVAGNVYVMEANTSGGNQYYWIVSEGSLSANKPKAQIASDSGGSLIIASNTTDGPISFNGITNVLTTVDTGSSIVSYVNSIDTCAAPKTYNRSGNTLTLNCFGFGASVKNSVLHNVKAYISELIVFDKVVDRNLIKLLEQEQIDTYNITP